MTIAIAPRSSTAAPSARKIVFCEFVGSAEDVLADFDVVAVVVVSG